MPVYPSTTKSWSPGGVDAQFLARIELKDGTYAQQSDFSAGNYVVWDMDDDLSQATGSLVIATVIFDTLQTDSRWTRYNDSIGYNFAWNCAAASIPEATALEIAAGILVKTYKVECWLTFTDASKMVVEFEHEVRITKGP